VPPRGWFDALKRTRRSIRDSNLSIVAAGVAFYAFLALVPALIAWSRSMGWSPTPPT